MRPIPSAPPLAQSKQSAGTISRPNTPLAAAKALPSLLHRPRPAQRPASPGTHSSYPKPRCLRSGEPTALVHASRSPSVPSVPSVVPFCRKPIVPEEPLCDVPTIALLHPKARRSRRRSPPTLGFDRDPVRNQETPPLARAGLAQALVKRRLRLLRFEAVRPLSAPIEAKIPPVLGNNAQRTSRAISTPH
jgi:hypothetical protein